MYFRSKTFLAALLAMTPFFATAATVDLNGKTYQTAVTHPVLLKSHQQSPQGIPTLFKSFNISAKLGESTTQSFAFSDVGNTCDYQKQQAIARTDYQWSCHYYDKYAYLDTNDYFVTGFKVSNANIVVSNNAEYRVFDLTFSPTASTIAQDSKYAGYAHNPTQLDGSPVFPSDTSIAAYTYDVWGYKQDIRYTPSGPTFPNSDYWTYLDVLPIIGTVQPADPITPVPVPGSAALLALGLLGLGAAKRRKT